MATVGMRQRRVTTTRACAVCGRALQRPPSRFRGVPEPVCGPPFACQYELLRRRAEERGGRYVDHDGYVRIRVPADHPLAHRNGYALEHRVVLSEKLGRWLRSDETVVWIDGDRTNNAPGNLAVRMPRRRAS